MQHTPCYGLLLAAGYSRRFGADKRLQTLPDTQASQHPETVATAAIKKWQAACAAFAGIDHLYIATRPNDALAQKLQPWLKGQKTASVDLLAVKDADLGMGHSLASAVTQIPAGALIIGLADMPFISTTTIVELARALRQSPADAIVQPVWQEAYGNPLGFGTAQRPALVNSAGDEGARVLVKAAKMSGALISLPVADPGIVHDIDVPADLKSQPPALPEAKS